MTDNCKLYSMYEQIALAVSDLDNHEYSSRRLEHLYNSCDIEDLLSRISTYMKAAFDDVQVKKTFGRGHFARRHKFLRVVSKLIVFHCGAISPKDFAAWYDNVLIKLGMPERFPELRPITEKDATATYAFNKTIYDLMKGDFDEHFGKEYVSYLRR